MKTIKFYWAFIAAFALLLGSCSKEDVGTSEGVISDNVAYLTLGPVLNAMQNDINKQQATPACTDDDPSYAMIRLLYGPNNVVVETEVGIKEDDQGLFTEYSEDLEIPVKNGNTVSITLTDFVVYNDDDVAIWAAPKIGSDYAKFVSDPLAREFSLRAGSKNYVNVDVLCIDDRTVNLYGYQFFDITPIKLYEFCVFANYCTDSGRHYTADYSLNLYEYSDGQMGDLIYENLSPNKGVDGDTFWADPLCMFVPGPGEGVDSDEEYLYFVATLKDWNYDGDEQVIEQALSWDTIQMLLDRDGDDDTTNYWHMFFNCDEEDGPSGTQAGE
ncbi:hypothetical protein [Christiangramia aquimixticola]|uniref:hypothetical protein n=1 Tax=Christiangramia aquimixticola TaxID=1697558 RepID=UPI003AA89F21